MYKRCGTNVSARCEELKIRNKERSSDNTMFDVPSVSKNVGLNVVTKRFIARIEDPINFGSKFERLIFLVAVNLSILM